MNALHLSFIQRLSSKTVFVVIGHSTFLMGCLNCIRGTLTKCGAIELYF